MKHVVIALLLVVLTGHRAHADLSAEDLKVLEKGELSDERVVAGGFIGTFIGFGLGHYIQGRPAAGVIFTLGEIVSLGIAFAGAVSESDQSLIGVSAAAFLGLRLVEIVEIWAGADAYNRHVRELRARQVAPVITPHEGPDGRLDGATAGFAFRF